jgi:hypothetical protein
MLQTVSEGAFSEGRALEILGTSHVRSSQKVATWEAGLYAKDSRDKRRRRSTSR